jgi:glyoxylase-like metal-dependent hydrolase (beta-lactamase superfamily II)
MAGVQRGSNPVTLAAMTREVAPGIHRLGNELVNFYVVEDGRRLALVDAGLPGFRGQLEEFLAGRGRTLGDIEAVLLTHAHADHVGVAEIVRAAGAAVYVHEADAEMARTAKPQSREGKLLPYFRHRATWRLMLSGLRLGAARTPKIASVTTFAEGDDLDVPARPRILHVPGHSNGHVVFHLPDRGTLLAGDAIVTYNPLTGREGPQIMPAAFSVSSAQATASLERLERLEAGVLLVGHGDPWTGGVAAAVARAREAGPS